MIRRYESVGLLAACLLLSVACEQPTADTPIDDLQPVVVYGSYEDQDYLSHLFTDYTKANGVVVIVRNGDADSIVRDIIDNAISPPADLLLTPTLSGVRRSAEEGAIRPLRSALIAERLPAWLRDPDDFWTAISYRTAVIAYDPNAYDRPNLSDYAALADAAFAGRLCLSSSSLAINRAVIATLIDELGVRPAEIAVRGWVKNLAQSVFDSEQKLFSAIESGECAIGIASSSAAQRARFDRTDDAIAFFTPANAAVNAEGMAIARHARNPDGARLLAEWLTGPQLQQAYAESRAAYPAAQQLSSTIQDPVGSAEVGGRNAVTAARYDSEAVKLAERARYR